MLFTFLATITAPIIAGTFNAMRDTYIAGYIARDYYRNAEAFIRGFRNGLADTNLPEASDTAESGVYPEQLASVALGYLDDDGYSEDDYLRYFLECHDDDEEYYDADDDDEPIFVECDDGLELLTVKELKSLSKSLKIPGYSCLRKAMLIATLRLHYSAE